MRTTLLISHQEEREEIMMQEEESIGPTHFERGLFPMCQREYTSLMDREIEHITHTERILKPIQESKNWWVCFGRQRCCVVLISL